MDYRKGVWTMKNMLIGICVLGLMTLASCKTGDEQLSIENQDLGKAPIIMNNENPNSSKEFSEKASVFFL